MPGIDDRRMHPYQAKIDGEEENKKNEQEDFNDGTVKKNRNGEVCLKICVEANEMQSFEEKNDQPFFSIDDKTIKEEELTAFVNIHEREVGEISHC